MPEVVPTLLIPGEYMPSAAIGGRTKVPGVTALIEKVQVNPFVPT
jgi:hypothetical protein